MPPIDFATLDTKQSADQGAVLRVLSPLDGTETGTTITLLGADSDVYRTMERRQNNKRNERIFSGATRVRVSQEEIEEDNLRKAVACTLGWDDMVLDGQQLEFNPENVRMMYDRFPWLYEQVWAFIQDRKNFLL